MILRHAITTWHVLLSGTALGRFGGVLLLVLLVVLPAGVATFVTLEAGSPQALLTLGLATFGPALLLAERRLPRDTLPMNGAAADRGELLALLVPAWAGTVLLSPALTWSTWSLAMLLPLTWVAPHLAGRTRAAALPTVVAAATLPWVLDEATLVVVAVLVGLTVAAAVAWAPQRSALHASAPRELQSAWRETAPVLSERDLLLALVRRSPPRIAMSQALVVVLIGWDWLWPSATTRLFTLSAGGLWVQATVFMLVAGSPLYGSERGSDALRHLPVPLRLALVDVGLRAGLVTLCLFLSARSAATAAVAPLLWLFALAGLYEDFARHVASMPTLQDLGVTARWLTVALTVAAVLVVLATLDVGAATAVRVSMLVLTCVAMVWIVRPVWHGTPA